MNDVTACPECGGATTLEDVQNRIGEKVEHVRTCNVCPTEYLLSYGNPIVEDITEV